METDMRRTGGTWPDQVTNPGGFLASRLRKLGTFAGRTPERTATTPQPGHGDTGIRDHATPKTSNTAVSAFPAASTGTGRAEAFAELAAARRRALLRRTAAAAADTARRDALIATVRAATPAGHHRNPYGDEQKDVSCK
ncbi:hypothetical protein [Mycolicibacterium sp. TY81]|uniref:hypothetical protein n=2 Tax=unclassified Mycolicibacterium TaxID=2636767 RepID=UPI001BB37AE3|nr:hypothetical protein [Mycolicibacterium sp. TY81]